MLCFWKCIFLSNLMSYIVVVVVFLNLPLECHLRCSFMLLFVCIWLSFLWTLFIIKWNLKLYIASSKLYFSWIYLRCQILSSWVGVVFLSPRLPPLGPLVRIQPRALFNLVFPGIILLCFPTTSRTETSFLVVSPWSSWRVQWISFASLRILGFTTRIKKLN